MSNKTADGAPAASVVSEKQQGRQENDGSLTFTSYPDGSAELEYAYFQHWWEFAASRVWATFVTAYLVWYLMPLPLLYWYWGPFVKRVLIVVVLMYLPKFLDRAEKTGGREWDSLRAAKVWRLSHRYFRTKQVREAPLDPQKQYIVNYHPHGVLVLSRIFFYGGAWEKMFPGVKCRVLAATPMFYVPLCREICLWMSAVDAGRKTAERMLKKGLSLMLYPGGSKELFLTDPNSSVTTLVLRERKGFIRLALRNGAHLVPVFVFGEKWCYNILRPPPAVRDAFLRTLKVPVLLFWGKWGTFVPLEGRVPLLAVYGKPIEVVRVENPTEEQVEALQARYIAAVQDLFERHKGRAGYDAGETLAIT